MRKPRISLLVFIVLFSLLTVPVFVISNSYELDEIGLVVNIPSKYDVITQDTLPYSSVFSDFGVHGTDLVERFKTTGIYLNAIPNYGFVITNYDIYDHSQAKFI